MGYRDKESRRQAIHITSKTINYRLNTLAIRFKRTSTIIINSTYNQTIVELRRTRKDSRTICHIAQLQRCWSQSKSHTQRWSILF